MREGSQDRHDGARVREGSQDRHDGARVREGSQDRHDGARVSGSGGGAITNLSDSNENHLIIRRYE